MAAFLFAVIKKEKIMSHAFVYLLNFCCVAHFNYTPLLKLWRKRPEL